MLETFAYYLSDLCQYSALYSWSLQISYQEQIFDVALTVPCRLPTMQLPG